MAMTFQTLDQISPARIVATFNEAFQGYYVPVDLTEELFMFKAKAEDIDLGLSTGAFEGDRMVGLILRGFRVMGGVNTTYNGGTGVVESQRGKNTVGKMYDFVRPLLAERDVKRELMEVMTQNASAIRAYEKRGFQVQREFGCFKGVPKALQMPEGYEMKEIRLGEAFAFESAWECAPAWQYAPKTIENHGDRHYFWGLFHQGELASTMVYDPVRSYVMHLYVAPAHRGKGIAGAWLGHIHQSTGKPVTVINVDTVGGAGLCSFFEAMGMESIGTQYEMACEFA